MAVVTYIVYDTQGLIHTGILAWGDLLEKCIGATIGASTKRSSHINLYSSLTICTDFSINSSVLVE